MMEHKDLENTYSFLPLSITVNLSAIFFHDLNQCVVFIHTFTTKTAVILFCISVGQLMVLQMVGEVE